MSQRITIKDIALKAGVSKGTVDRVLHNRGNVSPAVLIKVNKAIKELNYQRNLIASVLAYNRTWKIAVLMQEPENDPFWQQPKNGVDQALKAISQYGVSVEYFHFRDADTEHFVACANQVLEGDFDAVLAAPSFSKEGIDFLDKCHEQKLKYVLVNTYLQRKDKEFISFVGQNSYQSGMLAAKLLYLSLGKNDTAMIIHMEKEVYNAKHLIEKEKGFEDFFEQHQHRNIKVIRASYEEELKPKKLQKFLKKQFEKYPDIKGIFVTTSRAYHLVAALEQLNFDMDNIKLVGFDLLEQNLKYLREEKIDFLINQNPHKQGYLGLINIFNNLVQKKEINPLQFLPLDVVMLENLQYYIDVEDLQLIL